MLTVYLIMELKFVRLVKKIFLDILLIRHIFSIYYRYSNFNKVSILKFFVAYANELVYLIGEQKKTRATFILSIPTFGKRQDRL